MTFDSTASSTAVITASCFTRITQSHNQVRTVVKFEPPDMVVLDHCFIVRLQVAGQRGEAERDMTNT